MSNSNNPSFFPSFVQLIIGEAYRGCQNKTTESDVIDFSKRTMRRLEKCDFSDPWPVSAIVISIVFGVFLLGSLLFSIKLFKENKKLKYENEDLKSENFELKTDKENYHKAPKDNKKNNLKTQDDDNEARKVNFSDDVTVKLIERIGHKKAPDPYTRKKETCIIL